MKATAILTLTTAVLSLASAQAASEIPPLQDYAWHFPIHSGDPVEFLAIDVPLEVYRSVSDAEMRDLGVYNADSEAVPRTLDRPDEKVDDIEHRTALGMVPLYGEIDASLERLRLNLQRNGSSTSLQLDSESPGGDTPVDPQLRAYIIDLRERDETFAVLDFAWPADVPDFVGTVTIESGDDLSHWRHLAGGTLAELEFEGTRIVQQKVEIPPPTGEFLRLTWREMPDEWRLESVTGIQRQRGPDHPREWLTLQPVERSEDGREFTFDIGGYPPVDRVDLVLSNRNSVVRASVDYRLGPDHNWRRAHEGLFYRISRAGGEIRSEPSGIGANRSAQWKVRIQTGQVDGDIRLRLGWRPDRLLFLAQGDAPYTLATGRAQDRVEGFPQHRLLGDGAIFSLLKKSGMAGPASLGPRRESAGAVVMQGARTWTWRTVVVWIGLVVAVSFVGWLAWSLIRESK